MGAGWRHAGAIKTRATGGASGTSVTGQGSVTRLLGLLAIAAAVAFLVSGCSETNFFPAVHDMPAPRADTPLTPDQVKQATDALVSERDHLNTGAQATGQANQAAAPASAPAGAQATGTVAKP